MPSRRPSVRRSNRPRRRRPRRPVYPPRPPAAAPHGTGAGRARRAGYRRHGAGRAAARPGAGAVAAHHLQHARTAGLDLAQGRAHRRRRTGQASCRARSQEPAGRRAGAARHRASLLRRVRLVGFGCGPQDARPRFAVVERRQDARARQAGAPELGQWPGPRLRARGRHRRTVHVLHQAERREQDRQGDHAVSLGADRAPRPAQGRGHLCAARRPLRRLQRQPQGIRLQRLQGQQAAEDREHRRLGRHHRQVLDGRAHSRPEEQGRRHAQGHRRRRRRPRKYQVDYVGHGIAIAPGAIGQHAKAISSPAPRSCA